MINKLLTDSININRRRIIHITAVFTAVVFVCGCSRVNPPVYEDNDAGAADTETIENAEAIENTEVIEKTENTEITESKEDKEPIEDRKAAEPAETEGKSADTETEETSEALDISLLMAGDILLHIPIDRSCMLDDGSYDYSCIFENTKSDIEKADIALVNQEVIIGGKELGVTGYPSFNAPFEIGDALVDAGFDVICHATNHALDRGKMGVVNCIDYWDAKHPETAVIGIYDSKEDRDEIYIYEQDGIKIAILNYTYGTNGVKMPGDMPFAVNLLKKDIVASDIKRAEELADFTIVCPHWGTEYNLGVSTDQDNWTELFLENGADLVLGTHPHVIEPIEWIEDEQTGRKMLVYYSIGNYVNWTAGNGPGTSNRMVGGLALVNIGRDDDGSVVIKDYGVEAIVCHLTKEKQGITVYRLADYDERLAQSNEIINQDAGFSKQYCIDLCNKVWGNKWE